MSGSDSDSGSAWFHRERGGPVPQAAERKDSQAISGMWTKCEGCGEFLRTEVLDETARVCAQCGHHHAIGGYERLDVVVDPGTWEELDREVTSADPLSFVDSKTYPARLAGAIKKCRSNAAFAEGRARILGHAVQIGTFLFDFLGGSMGSAVGEKVTRMFERGVAEGTPVICISASGGARMQEGVLSLMQMARATAALARLRDARLPYVSVLTHPTTGGVAASFAMLGDVILAEPKSLIGFAGPRVIEQTIRQTLPEGFQRSEFLLEHGMIDQIVDRRELRRRIGAMLSLLTG